MRPQTTRAGCPDCTSTEGRSARQEWMMRTLEKQRHLVPEAEGVQSVRSLGSEEFLRNYYSANRPVLIKGRVAEWPAVKKWGPSYLKRRIGSAQVELQVGRSSNPNYERMRDLHRALVPFDKFIDESTSAGASNDAYITASNSATNEDVFKELHTDLDYIDELLSQNWKSSRGMVWLGPAGTFTPLHFDNINVLFLQIVGTKRFILAPPSETPNLYNDHHVYSAIQDIAKPSAVKEFPRLDGVTAYELILHPGDVLFIPVTWWHQVEALEFSVSISHTNFLWENDAYKDFPG